MDEEIGFTMSLSIGVAIALQIVAFAFLIPSGFALRKIVQSKWATSVEGLAVLVALVGLWIHGGSANHTYRIPQISLTILLLMRQSLGVYIHRKQNIHSGYVAEYLGHTYSIATLGLFTLGWYHITAGSLESVGIREHYYHTLSHALLLVLIMSEGLLLLSFATGLWPRQSSRTPDYYDSLLLLMCSLVMVVVLLVGYHADEDWYFVLIRIEHLAYTIMVLCGAITSIMVSTRKGHQTQRNIIPALVFAVLGLLFTSHQQEATLVKKVHETMGYTMVVGATFRMVEILVMPHWPAKASTDVHSNLRYVTALVVVILSFVAFGSSRALCSAIEQTGLMAPAYVAVLYTCGFVYFICEAINLLVIIPRALLTDVVLISLIHRVKDHWYPDGCDEKYQYSSLSGMHSDGLGYNPTLE